MDNEKEVEVVTSDLRALLFWACIGVHENLGGSYQDEIEHILESYGEHLNFKLPFNPVFSKKMRNSKKPRRHA